MASSSSSDDMPTADDLTGKVVEILIGPDKVSYFVHESLLRKNSKFFTAALKEEWNQGQKRPVELIDEKPDAVSCYLQWLYNRKVADHSTYHLLALYLLAERLLDDGFQNATINLYIWKLQRNILVPCDQDIRRIYEGTAASSPARRLIVNSHVEGGHKDHITCGGWNVPDEFKDDLLRGLFNERTFSSNSKKEFVALKGGSRCVYHKHGDDKSCPLK